MSRWHRWIGTVVVAVLLAAGVPARAQEGAGGAAALAGVEELETLVETLEDPAAREQLVGELRTLIAARQAVEQEAPASPGAAFLQDLSERLSTFGQQLAGLVEKAGDVSRIPAWLGDQARDPDRRALWLEVVRQLAWVVIVGGVVGWATGRFLARPRQALVRREAIGFWLRIPVVAARTFLDVLPLAAFAATAYATLAIVQPSEQVRLVALAVINAVVVARGALIAFRLVFTPLAPNLRLLSLKDETSAYLFVWVRRLVNVTVYGYFTAEAALALGASPVASSALLKLVGLTVAAMLFVLVLQNRGTVAASIRGAKTPEAPARPLFQTVRNRLADVWHVLAALYLAVGYGVWVLEIEGGFLFVARGTVMTLVILVVARLVLDLVRRAAERTFRVSAEIKARFPLIEARANRYLPVVQRVLQSVIAVIAVLALLQAWQVDVLGWLATPAGAALLGRLLNVAAVIVVSILVWEAASGVIARYLESGGEAAGRSGRVRTLLPLARNALLVVIAVIATLTILSELGIDIAPLLAGAGVAGLAIGFGAQRLVRDVITGAFILFEDSIHVGDVVNVGERAGIVEAITIRTIRLRDLSGNVHTIPFSSVETVTNMTKEFSYALLDVGVAYRENTDEVVAVLEEIAEELRQDPEYGPQILEPLQVLGVDRFEDSAVVIRARIKTRPIRQWGVKREFNRRMKIRFDEEGIEIPFPHQTVYFGVDKEGEAPPARFRVEGREPERGAEAPTPAAAAAADGAPRPRLAVPATEVQEPAAARKTGKRREREARRQQPRTSLPDEKEGDEP
ncbi:MAG: mechanosensitive ion channel family protein [Alphaproteobacteria bacterium]